MDLKKNLQVWPVERVKPYDNNVKKHPEDQVARIAKSITEFGWDQPIVVDKNGVVIKGHGRRLAAIKLGLKEVPVLIRDDLTDPQVAAARLADNRAAMSDIDTEMLQKELAALAPTITTLEGIFDKKELAFLDVKVDLGELNAGAFVSDLDVEVAKQSAETVEKLSKTDQERSPLAKVFGFKEVTVAQERKIVAFMAEIEAETGLKGADALVAFIDSRG